MPLRAFDHVNIRTTNLGPMVDFYEDLLGLKVGPRPDFGFPGAWLYLKGAALVHLVGIDADPPAVEAQKLRLEHFAFSASGYEEFIARLERAAIAYDPRHIDDFRITQINIADPDGNHIHIDFSQDEVAEKNA